ncbi:MAG: PEP-CTERM sorting domain-containing protein [Planctomycetales bacterium]|nr:PEP-CTERM sorting domain-containing protein [Planctomycetales bacterium]MCA9171883.1 PEP-CTERM sorting domain-containing protein [Planctomycetales bacterium]
MKRFFNLFAATAFCCVCANVSYAQWSISTYKGLPTTGQITNYATADALIGGAYLDPAFPVTEQYTLANTQDNDDAGGPFGLGTQVAGLPAGDTDDFVFVGTGQLKVLQAGSYVFVTNTDDGSRLRGGVNGGAFVDAILDDVLSGPHDVPSPALDFAAGDIIDFEWMWFERGGGAEGEFYYRADTGAGFGPNALVGDSSQGLELVGGSLTGKTYKSIVTPGQVINNFADAQSVIESVGSLKGTELRDVFNIVGDGDGDADFPGGQRAPGLDGAADDYVAVGTGYVKVGPGQAGEYIFRSNTDDGGRLRLDLNQDGIFDASEAIIDHDVLQGPTNTDSAGIMLAEGLYKVEYSFFERGGGDEGEVSARRVDMNEFYLLGDDAAGGLDVVTVPEPASLTLAGLAALALGMFRRRK